jgi:hypothetical protein
MITTAAPCARRPHRLPPRGGHRRACRQPLSAGRRPGTALVNHSDETGTYVDGYAYMKARGIKLKR